VKKPDSDNVVKVVADSLNGIAYRDDVQLVDVSMRKFYAERPRVEVGIREAARWTSAKRHINEPAGSSGSEGRILS
jgi:hypothetical protein